MLFLAREVMNVFALNLVYPSQNVQQLLAEGVRPSSEFHSFSICMLRLVDFILLRVEGGENHLTGFFRFTLLIRSVGGGVVGKF